MKNKILIIDDSTDIIFAISEFFKIKNWEVFSALSIEEALKIVSMEKLDIILIDYHMPYINGVVGVKMIRQLNKETPIIALTVENTENIAEEFFEAGVNDFAIKPIKVLDLFSRVNVHLRNKEQIEEKRQVEDNVEDITPYQKGINPNTVILIKESMEKLNNYSTIDEISELTGLASQTINKYMNYLVEIGLVDLKLIYGKIGRPRNEYMWKENKE